MARSIPHRLGDILTAIASLREGLATATLERVESEIGLRWILERGVEIISEASRHIPDELRAEHAGIEWRRIARIGDLIRHHYHRIEAGVLWGIFQNELDPLEAAVRDLLARYDAGGSGSSGSAAR